MQKHSKDLMKGWSNQPVLAVLQRKRGGAWRVKTTDSFSGWALNVFHMRFYAGDGTELQADEAVQSGAVSDPEHGGIGGYEPENAIFRDGIWGGRRESYDPPLPFYLGAKFTRPVEVAWVKWTQHDEEMTVTEGFLVPPTHSAPFCKMTVEVECDGVWQSVSHRVVKPEDIGRDPYQGAAGKKNKRE